MHRNRERLVDSEQNLQSKWWLTFIDDDRYQLQSSEINQTHLNSNHRTTRQSTQCHVAARWNVCEKVTMGGQGFQICADLSFCPLRTHAKTTRVYSTRTHTKRAHVYLTRTHIKRALVYLTRAHTKSARVYLTRTHTKTARAYLTRTHTKSVRVYLKRTQISQLVYI